MKFFKKIYAILMAFIFIFVLTGFANKVNAEVLTYTVSMYTATTGTNDVKLTSPNTTFTHNDIMWTLSTESTTQFYTTNKDRVQIGKKDAPETKAVLETTGFAGKVIDSASITGFCSSNVGPTITIKAGSTIILDAKALVKTNSTEYKSDNTSEVVLGANDKLTFEFNSSAAAAIVFSKIEVKYHEVENKTLTSLSKTGEPVKTSYYTGDTFDSTGLTITANYSNETSSDVSNQVSWTPSPLTAGTTSVTGSFSYNGGESKTVVIDGLTVVDYIPHDGTLEDPLNIKDAIDVIEENELQTTETAYYVKGIITKIEYFNAPYLSFTLKDSLDQEESFKAFHILKNADGDEATYADNAKLIIGATAIVYGKLSYYKADSVYETEGGTAGVANTTHLVSIIYPTYDALLHYNNGNADETISSSSETGFFEIQDPLNEGYVFDGWYTEETFENLFDFDEFASKDVELYARWLLKHQKDVNNISAALSLSYSYDATINNQDTKTVKLEPAVDNGSVSEANYKGVNIANLFTNTSELEIYAAKNKATSSNIYVKSSAAKDGKIRLYPDRDNGNGTTFTISSKYGYITKVELEEVSTNMGTISINNGVAIIQCTGNEQLQLDSITITYTTYAYSYTNADFRLRVGIEDAISQFDDIDEYGICISDGKTTKHLNGAKLHDDYDEDMLCSIIDLGDIINNLTNGQIKFTVKAYTKVGDTYYYSENAKTYSVADMVKVYFQMGGEIQEKVNGLYRAFEKAGCYNAD